MMVGCQLRYFFALLKTWYLNSTENYDENYVRIFSWKYENFIYYNNDSLQIWQQDTKTVKHVWIFDIKKKIM